MYFTKHFEIIFLHKKRELFANICKTPSLLLLSTYRQINIKGGGAGVGGKALMDRPLNKYFLRLPQCNADIWLLLGLTPWPPETPPKTSQALIRKFDMEEKLGHTTIKKMSSIFFNIYEIIKWTIWYIYDNSIFRV